MSEILRKFAILTFGICIQVYALPTAIEPKYLEAVIEIQKKRFSQALATLKPLIASYPNDVKLLELEALASKGAGQIPRAKGIYQKLLGQHPVKGPYLFQLGALAYQAKQTAEAKKYFNQCLQEPFNTESSHFFLGKIDFDEKKFSTARDHFLWVMKSKVDDLKPVTLVYLGQISAAFGKTNLAARFLVQARNQADRGRKDETRPPEARELASQVVESVDKSLAGLGRGGVFGSVTLNTGYDSNTLLSPVGGTNPDGSSNLGSVVSTLMPEIGYGTSPLRSWQATAHYRGAFNYNFNTSTRTGQFAINQIGLAFGRGIASTWSIGGKAELQSIFQHTGSTYENFSLQVNAGPTFRTEISKQWIMGAELLFSPHNNYRDPQFSYSLRRTGMDESLRVYFRQESRDKFWNPEIAFNQVFSRTVGDEFRNLGAGLELVDRMFVSDSLTFITTLGGRYMTYTSRPVRQRFDTQGYISAAAVYGLTSDIRIGTQFLYFANLSNITDAYDYRRYVANLSGTYSF